MTDIRLTRVNLESVIQDPNPDIRLTRVNLEVVIQAVPPTAPQNPAAVTQSATSILVSWDSVSGADGYYVERSLDGSTGWTDVSGNIADPTVTYLDTGLTQGTQYFYRIVAFNNDGDSPPSTVVDDTTQPIPSGNRMGGTGAIRRRGGVPR